MSSSPIVTILMTVKNVSKTIEKCFTSLKSQQFDGAYEIVVIDAYSTDGTYEYLEDQRRSFKCLSIYRKESTQPEALQYAFDARCVTTKYVAFIDGDAVADPRWLHELVSSMDQGKLVVGGPCYTPGDVNLVQRIIGYDLDMRFLRMKEGAVTRLPNMNLCVNTEFFSQLGFDTSLALGYDMELGHRLRERGQSIWFNPRAIVWHYHRASIPAYIKQQISGAEYALRVMWLHPSAARGDNVNPLNMLIDAPLLILTTALLLLSPFGLVFQIASFATALCLLSSLFMKTLGVIMRFKRLESLLCFPIYIIRVECWMIGLAEFIRKSIHRRIWMQ